MKHLLSTRIQIIIIILFTLITRFPQLKNENLILDGDECIVALMAKHANEGKQVPLYFYGQQYGFSAIEYIPVQVFFKLISTSDISVKIAMLLLWIAGVLLFYGSLKKVFVKQNIIPFFITLVFIASPVWLIWSTKARGGYISAFLISNLIIFIIFTHHKKQIITSLVIGILLSFLIECQIMWLPGLLPFLYFYLNKHKSYSSVLFMLTSFTLLFIGLRFYKKSLYNFWTPKIIAFDVDIWTNFKLLFKNIYINFQGNYFHRTSFENPLIIKFLAITLLVSLVFTLLLGLWFIFKKSNLNNLSILCSISLLGSISYVVLIPDFHYRYLLPLSGYLFFALGVNILSLTKFKTLPFILLVVIILGAYAQITFKNSYEYFADKPQLQKVINKLKEKQIRSTFAADPLLQWQIIFYSNEEVLSRYIFPFDRYRPYSEQINEDSFDPNKSIALVAYYNQIKNTNSPQVELFDSSYTVVYNPSIQALSKFGFYFQDQ